MILPAECVKVKISSNEKTCYHQSSSGEGCIKCDVKNNVDTLRERIQRAVNKYENEFEKRYAQAV